uniref:DM2 domain-containing protein n=1 Tax=viral metagenome TaxID=1070528 RepID=A0A6C0E7K2_9ZZZZ
MKVKSTTFANEDHQHSTPIIVEKEMSARDAIREFVQSQSMHTFGMLQAENIIEAIVNGFFLFNSRENKYMLNSKDELLQYCKDNSVSLEEKMYFWDIFLFTQRPKFLTPEEHDYIRDCGDLDGYIEKQQVVSGGGSNLTLTLTPPYSFSYSSSSPKNTSGFVKPTLISDQLAMFLGKPLGTKITRTDVCRELNTYISIHHLQSPYNGRIINPDEKLKNLLNINDDVELTYFNLRKYMKHHFHK